MKSSTLYPMLEADTKWCPTVGAQFERQVARQATRVAIRATTSAITYADLNARANRLANVIRARCGGQTRQVALLFDRSEDSVAGMLGSLKAGTTYVPLDPTWPRPRIAHMLDDSQAALVLTNTRQRELAAALAAGRCDIVNTDELEIQSAVEHAGYEVDPRTPAYILYTSGSTGSPKGVVQTQRNLLHFVRSYSTTLGITAEDRLTQLFSVSFSAVHMDIFGALLNGATLCPYDLKQEGLSGLAEWLVREEITIFHTVPTVFRNFLASVPAGATFPHIRMIDVGGEPLYRHDVEAFQKHFADSCVLVNHLAFTEASVVAQHPIQITTPVSGPRAPVGCPAAGIEILLLNEEGVPVEAGETGEIVVRSEFLSPGYWRASELTRAAFSAPVDGDPRRTYRSGDLGRWLPDGTLEHLGRNDSRVKIRGHRIELAEIEQALLRLEGVREAVVVVNDADPRELWLVAFVVRRSEQCSSATDLRQQLRATLPDWMLPRHVTFLPSLPLTNTGKVDRRALASQMSTGSDIVPQRLTQATVTEQAVGNIWQRVLGVPVQQRTDHFFELGGDSILAFRMLLELERTLGVRLAPGDLVEWPSLALFAARVERALVGDEEEHYLVPLQREGNYPALFCVPPAGTSVLVFRALARRLGSDQPLIGLQHRGLGGRHAPHRRIDVMAERYVEAIRQCQPRGPYYLAGMCVGGTIAFEMALQLRAAGEQVAFLGVLDTLRPPPFPLPRGASWKRRLRRAWDHTSYRIELLVARVRRFRSKVARLPALLTGAGGRDKNQDIMAHLASTMDAHREAVATYRPRHYDGPITLFQTANRRRNAEQIEGWGLATTGQLEVVQIPGRHGRRFDNPFIEEPNVALVAQQLSSYLAQARNAFSAAQQV